MWIIAPRFRSPSSTGELHGEHQHEARDEHKFRAFLFHAVGPGDVARVPVQQRRHAEAVDDATHSDCQSSLDVEFEEMVGLQHRLDDDQ